MLTNIEEGKSSAENFDMWIWIFSVLLSPLGILLAFILIMILVSIPLTLLAGRFPEKGSVHRAALTIDEMFKMFIPWRTGNDENSQTLDFPQFKGWRRNREEP